MNSRLLLLLPTIFVIYCKSCEGQCSSNPCDNGGSCVSAGNAHTCNCPAGHTGPRCERQNWAPCLSSPCIHGGTCNTTNMTSYSCVCPAEWTGINCDDSTMCLSNPCEHGGTCELYGNVTKSYECSCTTNWKGTHCEKFNWRLEELYIRIGIALFLLFIYASGQSLVYILLKKEDEEENEEEEEEEVEEDEGMWTTFVSMAFGTDYGMQPEPSPSATQAPATG